MPTYEYRCAKCGEELEVFQTFAEAPLTKHQHCGGKLAKVLSPAGIVLKGSGFYKTDNRSSSKRSGGSESRSSESGGSSKSGDTNGSDSSRSGDSSSSGGSGDSNKDSSSGSGAGSAGSSSGGSGDSKKPAAKSA